MTNSVVLRGEYSHSVPDFETGTPPTPPKLAGPRQSKLATPFFGKKVLTELERAECPSNLLGKVSSTGGGRIEAETKRIG